VCGANGLRVSQGRFRVVGCGAFRLGFDGGLGGEAEETALFARGGLVDFSVETGFPRLFYGALSNDYEDTFAGSGSLRYGFSDHLTLEAHAEGTTELANGGIGASLGIDRAGIVSAAFAGSTHGGSSGGQVYAAFDTTLFGISLIASSLTNIPRLPTVILTNDDGTRGFIEIALKHSAGVHG
jgi:outer membrane usher protein